MSLTQTIVKEDHNLFLSLCGKMSLYIQDRDAKLRESKFIRSQGPFPSPPSNHPGTGSLVSW